jgi:fibronectin-binding autotransporter adhesin
MVRRVCLLAAVALGLSSSSAMAATINVTTTAGTVANDGLCSLREAIIAANTDTPSGSASGECPAGTPGGNEIVLGPGEYSLASGELRVSSQLTLVGQGATTTTINGNGVDRVLDVLDDANLTARNLSVINGQAPNGTPASGSVPGTAGASGGGILNAGSLTLQEVTVSGNAAGAGGGGVAGSAADDAPGAGGSGGGIESTGPTLTVIDSTIAGNTAGSGGNANLAQVGGAGGGGGGIDADSGSVEITASTISGNKAGIGGFGGLVGGAGGNGGGLLLAGSVTATLTNDTIASNSGGHANVPLPPAGRPRTAGRLPRTAVR